MRFYKQQLTVMLIPQGGAKTYTFQVRSDLILGIVVLLVVLVLLSLMVIFSYGKLFAASQEKSRLQEQVNQMSRQLEQIDELQLRVLESEKARAKVLAILGARGEAIDTLGAPVDPARMVGMGREELRLRQEDFMRSVPRGWPVLGPVTRTYLAVGEDDGGFHPGMDIAAPTGTPVRASAAGTVTFAGWDPEYGYLVVVEHGLGLETRYGHNVRLSVAEGDRVERGQLVAAVGSTGRSTAAHLHFEIRKDGIPIDPKHYLE